jgi:hypothetical protein
VTASGTGRSAGAFGVTFVELNSQLGNPPSEIAIFAGNFTPPKSL